MHKRTTLPNDYFRCNGVGFPNDDDPTATDWREGCETCLRRTAPRPKIVSIMDPPQIIAFECENLIEP